MGGLFSCNQEEPPRAQSIITQTPTRIASSFTSHHHQSVHPPSLQAVARVAPSTTSSLCSGHNTAYKPATSTSSHRAILTTAPRLPLAPAVYEESPACEWNLSTLPHRESFRLVNLSEYEEDFSMVEDAFYNGAKGKNFKITKIERVENPFTLGCYLLKKEEMNRRYGYVKEAVHFHGTKKCNINQICENNFSWRLHGDNTGHRYGKGVSFSPISFYASHYSDRNDTDKVMFYVSVLVSYTVVGNGNMVLPPKLIGSSNSRYDTAEKQDSKVVVKFSDNEFYPQFLIHYKTPAVPTKPKHRYQPRHVKHTPQPTYCYASDDYYCDDY